MFLAELKKKAKQIVYAYFAPNFQTTVQLDNVYVAWSNTCNSNNCLLQGPPRPGGYGPGPQMGPGGPRMMSHGGMPPHPYAGNHRNEKLHCRF